MSNAVVTDWPSGSANTGWPQEPSAMLMPGRVEGWPAGTQRAANAAERLLSQAVAWWDVGQYRDGDRFLRNRGTGGELLDLRLGSSIAANSNDPRYLAPEDSGYVYLPGVLGNSVRISHAANQNTTDLDVRTRVAMDSWTPSALEELVSKRGASPNLGWMLRLNTTSRLELRWSSDGTTETTVNSSSGGSNLVSTRAANGAALWVRVTLDVDNGAGAYEVKFYTAPDSPDVPTSWTQLGSTITGGSTTSLFASTAIFADSGSAGVKTGKLYRLQLMDSIDGTAVVDIDCDAITSGSATSFTAVTNQTVTINRSTTGRKSVAVPSRHKGGKPVMLLGTDDYLEVQDNWQHGLLNFAQGDSFTVVALSRSWGTTSGYLITKAESFSVGSIGYGSVFSGGSLFFRNQDGVVAPAASQTLPSSGVLSTNALVRTATPRRISVSVNGTAGTAVIDTTTTIPTNTLVLRVGRASGTGSSYTDMEFYAAAIFRRALSPTEITLLSNYFTGRIA